MAVPARTDALDVIVELLAELDKQPAVIGDGPGFYDRLCSALCSVANMQRAGLLLYDEARQLVVPVGWLSSSASSSTITSGASVRAGTAMGMLYPLAVLERQAERLLGGQRHRARVPTGAAAADRLGLEVVDQQGPVDLAGEAGSTGERGGHETRVVVPSKAGKFERLLHVQRVPNFGHMLNR